MLNRIEKNKKVNNKNIKKYQEGMNMKFAKGLVVGTLISAGIALYCSETTKGTRKRMMKQGKKMIKNMGWM